ncbi:MAG TPA: preprotein translocase subunit SecE [Jiangellales bacterium]|nr:preprotein translocase subunit SecE [Jiangellales bacterium]
MTETRGQTATPERDRPPRRGGRGMLARLRAWPSKAALFVRQVVAELRKVVYPTRNQLLTYTAVVLVFVGVMIAIVSVLDLVFGWATLAVFG